MLSQEIGTLAEHLHENRLFSNRSTEIKSDKIDPFLNWKGDFRCGPRGSPQKRIAT